MKQQIKKPTVNPNNYNTGTVKAWLILKIEKQNLAMLREIKLP